MDFSKSFDHVLCNGMLIKHLLHGIGGKFYASIKQMYCNTISAVKINNNITSTFKTEFGVKQGDNLLPNLFNSYLNDLNFPEDPCDPITLSSNSIFHLLWADDLLILSETPTGLQKCLDISNSYCNKWRLAIDIQKSNVIVIGKGRRGAYTNLEFHIGNQSLTKCKEYKYLGCTVNSNGNFTVSRKDLSLKATKVLYKLQRSFSDVSPSPELYNKLFDTLVKPVTLYNCEIWTADNINRLTKYFRNKVYELSENDLHEKLHNKFCKSNLLVQSNSINIVCRAELGRFPLTLEINASIIKFYDYLENFPSYRTSLLDAVKCSKNLNTYSWHKSSETLMNKKNISLEQCEQTPNHVMNKTGSFEN